MVDLSPTTTTPVKDLHLLPMTNLLLLLHLNAKRFFSNPLLFFLSFIFLRFDFLILIFILSQPDNGAASSEKPPENSNQEPSADPGKCAQPDAQIDEPVAAADDDKPDATPPIADGLL